VVWALLCQWPQEVATGFVDEEDYGAGLGPGRIRRGLTTATTSCRGAWSRGIVEDSLIFIEQHRVVTIEC